MANYNKSPKRASNFISKRARGNRKAGNILIK